MTKSVIRDRHKIIFPRVCFSCGQEKDARLLVLHIPEMKTYCRDLEDCTNPKGHIFTLMERYPDLPEYQSVPIRAYSADILEQAIETYFPDNAYESLLRLIGKTATARFNTRQALFLCKLAQEKDFSSIQEMLRYVVDYMLETEEGKQIMQTELVKTNLVK